MRTYYLTHPHSQCKWISEDMPKQRVKNIIQLFFFLSIHTQTKEALQPLLTLYFLCFCLSLAFFFLVSMKDSCSHLTKMWAWLKAIRTTEFSKKLIVFNLIKASQCTRHNQFVRWKDSIFPIKRKNFFIA